VPRSLDLPSAIDEIIPDGGGVPDRGDQISRCGLLSGSLRNGADVLLVRGALGGLATRTILSFRIILRLRLVKARNHEAERPRVVVADLFERGAARAGQRQPVSARVPPEPVAVLARYAPPTAWRSRRVGGDALGAHRERGVVGCLPGEHCHAAHAAVGPTASSGVSAADGAEIDLAELTAASMTRSTSPRSTAQHRSRRRSGVSPRTRSAAGR